MKVRFLRSFAESKGELEEPDQHDTDHAVDSLLSYFHAGQKTHGLGLKKIHEHYWEIRVGLRIRVLFSLEKDILTFILVGDHDAIKRFLHHRP